MVERRRFPRTKVYKPAKLIVGGRSMLSCVVRDVSKHGACLHLQSTASVPEEFDLSFDTGQMLRKCRVAWRTLTNVGVSFDPTATL
jgi:methyl-accepting chemotaxis protein